MAVNVYKSTDVDAPSLNGSVGTLLAVLDACLVDGYTGKLGAGWAKAFTGTNKRVYRAASGNRYYLRVDDTGTNIAYVSAFETMSDVDTGTNQFPTSTQISTGFTLYKSSTANTQVRPWILIATDTFFYLFINQADNGTAFISNAYWVSYFGDFYSYKGSDTFNTILCCNDGAGYASLGSVQYGNPASGQRVLARKYDGIHISPSSGLSSLTCEFHLTPVCGFIPQNYCVYNSTGYSHHVMGGQSGWGNAWQILPDPVTNRIFLSPFYISEQVLQGASHCIRGWLPGLYASSNNFYSNAASNHGFELAGEAGTDLEGKTFLGIYVYAQRVNANGFIWVEISDTWLSKLYT